MIVVVPAGTQIGDVIVVLDGRRCLTFLNSFQGSYRFIGEAYMYGNGAIVCMRSERWWFVMSQPEVGMNDQGTQYMHQSGRRDGSIVSNREVSTISHFPCTANFATM